MLFLHFLSPYSSFSSTVTSPCYHPFANSCICGFNARPKQRDWVSNNSTVRCR
ncbi:hypothetical protein T4A_10299 [Trichinella pseudospiralis]|uniref:Uncharacterized protein n=1 Tax=Trichinella pseudospiralis TaxID=6337 RepID=A0A0V1D569_TRIPS|nr:hypothetical protein T4A_10299 [Trichinella pseudospiralis]